jgi:XTP/dITP diphosphohydrolase
MRRLLIATSNKGKLPEILAALGDVPFDIVTLNDIDGGTEPEEPGNTMEGNALIKAFTYGKRTGLLTIAEDTGLEVDALGGAPGVHTKRYGNSDDDRNKKILQELASVSDENRTARFKTVAVMYDPDNDAVRLTEGVCEGRILREYRGNKSFGFGPIFFVDELGHTLSEVETDVRNSVSHRGRALKKLREILVAEFA